MSKEPVSRIYKTHSQITADIENDDIEVGINGLAAFLKEALSKSEEDLKTVTRWIQSKKRYLRHKVDVLDISDANRKVLLDEVEQLEMLRRQLLTIFLAQQSVHQALITAEQELLKKYDLDNGNVSSAAPAYTSDPTEAKKQKKPRKLNRR